MKVSAEIFLGFISTRFILLVYNVFRCENKITEDLYPKLPTNIYPSFPEVSRFSKRMISFVFFFPLSSNNKFIVYCYNKNLTKIHIFFPFNMKLEWKLIFCCYCFFQYFVMCSELFEIWQKFTSFIHPIICLEWNIFLFSYFVDNTTLMLWF